MSKRISISEDTALPMGWVAISLAQVGQSGSEMTIRISRRQTDRPYLGRDGWQSTPHDFVPRQVRADGDSQVLMFGPEVTERLAVDMRLDIEIPAVGLKESHLWPEIAGAPGASDVSVDMPSQMFPTGEREGGTRVPHPSQPSKEGERGRKIVDPDEEGDGEPPLIVDPDQGGVRRRPLLRWVILLLVLLGLLAALAFYLWSQQETGSPVVAPVEDTTEPPLDTGPDFDARYRELRDEGGHAEELLALGREAIAAGEDNIGFIAVTLAADRNSPDAAMQMGMWQDPLEEARFSDMQSNAGNAALYYQQALEQGQPEAESRLRRLCEAAGEGARSAPEIWAMFDTASICQ